MKKSLIALAVMAASGATFAQSNATIYGTLDVAFGHTTGLSTNQNVLASGGVSSPNFGFKGSEDLGGGLKANFKLEQGFNNATGQAGITFSDTFMKTPVTGAFSRYAYVGFSGGFGEVKLGKTGTAYDDINGATDATFDANALGPQNLAFRSGGYNWNPANSIYYATPTMSGFAGAISYSLGENKNPAANAGSIVSVNVTYNGGPVYAGLAYQAEKLNGAATTVGFTRLNGSYDLKVAKLLASYGKVSAFDSVSGHNTTEWQLGADVPVSASLVLSGGYADSKDNDASGGATRKGYSFAAAMPLSKRTTLYGGYESTKVTVAGSSSTSGLLAAGVKHTF